MPRNAITFEVKDEDFPSVKTAGAYCFMLNQAGVRMGIKHTCPCGCGRWSAMWFKGFADAGGPEWDVVGQWPKVTLSPSIGVGRGEGLGGGYHWHGYLRAGVFVEE